MHHCRSKAVAWITHDAYVQRWPQHIFADRNMFYSHAPCSRRRVGYLFVDCNTF